MEDTISSWFEPECSVSGNMNPLRYYGGYENDQKYDWPGQHHFVNYRNSMCGRKVHETHNHDFWNTHLGGKFNTDNENDVCFAYEGIIDKFRVYGEFTYTNDEGQTKPFKDWMSQPVNWQSKRTYKHICFKITDTIAPGNYYDGNPLTSGITVYIVDSTLCELKTAICQTFTLMSSELAKCEVKSQLPKLENRFLSVARFLLKLTLDSLQITGGVDTSTWRSKLGLKTHSVEQALLSHKFVPSHLKVESLTKAQIGCSWIARNPGSPES